MSRVIRPGDSSTEGEDPPHLPGCNGEATLHQRQESRQEIVVALGGIGSLDQLSSMLAGDGGTRTSMHAEGMETR
ncbi:hypothetical protein [Geodermatophilus sabuli]|uniref:Uncharacterized protein n=1 Tax=Geodermatophilus sabuli TaxID=1564158 RepID=A0A285EEA2_9ACTN|nr:hypothetical protein [Geodermatophilus sabuli]MBB3084485.1 hypothetical protein [Geodermatophilus sabuli]SNX97320.1 hypothetical protein SAMN06893097_106270 [Geodermatophilus sabuli]